MPLVDIYFNPSVIGRNDVFHFSLGVPSILHKIMGTPTQEQDSQPVWVKHWPNELPADHMADFELRIGFEEDQQRLPAHVVGEYRRQLVLILNHEPFLQGVIEQGTVLVRTHILCGAEVSRVTKPIIK